MVFVFRFSQKKWYSEGSCGVCLNARCNESISLFLTLTRYAPVAYIDKDTISFFLVIRSSLFENDMAL